MSCLDSTSTGRGYASLRRMGCDFPYLFVLIHKNIEGAQSKYGQSPNNLPRRFRSERVFAVVEAQSTNCFVGTGGGVIPFRRNCGSP